MFQPHLRKRPPSRSDSAASLVSISGPLCRSAPHLPAVVLQWAYISPSWLCFYLQQTSQQAGRAERLNLCGSLGLTLSKLLEWIFKTFSRNVEEPINGVLDSVETVTLDLPKITGDEQSLTKAFNPLRYASLLWQYVWKWAACRRSVNSECFVCLYVWKRLCSPLNGDVALCKVVGEELETGEPPTVGSLTLLFREEVSVSLSFFVSSTSFIAGLKTFAFPLAGMCMQPQSKQTRDVIAHSTKRGQ